MAAGTQAPAAVPAPAGADATTASRWAAPWRRELLALAFVSVASVVIAVVTFKLWRLPDIHAPLSSVGDNASLLASVKAIAETGWYQHDPALGWPFGQDFYDFGANGADNLHYALLFVLSRVATQAGLIENVFILLSFPMCAVAAYAAFRWLGISRVASVVPAVLFAVVPYHFLRAPYGHGLIAEYSSVPAGAFLALAVLLGLPLFARRAGGRRGLRWLSWRTVGTLALCAWVASGGIYYAAFGLFLIGVAGLAALLSRGGRGRTALSAGVVLGAVLAVLVFNELPTLVYKHVHGPNTVAGVRAPAESEVYAFKLAQFVFPSPVHRIGRLGAPARRYDAQSAVLSEGSSWPGTLPLLGLALVLAGLMARVASERTRGFLADRRLGGAGLLAVSIFALGTLGGGGSLIAWALTPSLRSWTRVSIVLAFFGFLGLALALDALRTRVRRPAVAAGVLAVVLAVGVFDQTSPAFAPDYALEHAEWTNDGHFVDAIERTLGGHGEIYQLPYVAFPESPPVFNMLDYSLYKGYLHAGPELRWSYGAMRGRPADWQYWLSLQPLDVQLRGAAAAGFDGVWIDRNGFTDPEAVMAPLRRLTGVAPLISENGRLAFFDLRPFAATLPKAQIAALRRATLYPAQISLGAGFYPPEGTTRWAAGQASVSVTVPAGAAQRVHVRGRLATPSRAPATLALDGRVVATVQTTRRGAPLDQVVSVGPGAHTLTFATPAPAAPPAAAGDTRDLRLQLSDLVIGADPLVGP